MFHLVEDDRVLRAITGVYCLHFMHHKCFDFVHFDSDTSIGLAKPGKWSWKTSRPGDREQKKGPSWGLSCLPAFFSKMLLEKLVSSFMIAGGRRGLLLRRTLHAPLYQTKPPSRTCCSTYDL
ncbi:unnamed protein product [Amoebophrya sp. A120]|nr:unnamed protein product [Amoebophrya sp. A120]|eukprot:GSA120T00018816001.1